MSTRSNRRKTKSSNGLGRIPSYRRHKASGQAVVTLDGRDHYLGRHGTTASEAEYNRLIAEWLAHGRRLPGDGAAPMMMAELMLAFIRHCDDYYKRSDGSPTREPGVIRLALRVVRATYADLPARDFGPSQLRMVRDEMIARRWSRKSINNQINRVRRMFRWAVERDMLPPSFRHVKLSPSDGRQSMPRGKRRSDMATDRAQIVGARPSGSRAWCTTGTNIDAR